MHLAYGDSLKYTFNNIFNLYYNYFDIVCLMGEGKETLEDKIEMINYCKYIHSRDKMVALYSGRDTYIEDWMNDALKKVKVL